MNRKPGSSVQTASWSGLTLQPPAQNLFTCIWAGSRLPTVQGPALSAQTSFPHQAHPQNSTAQIRAQEDVPSFLGDQSSGLGDWHWMYGEGGDLESDGQQCVGLGESWGSADDQRFSLLNRWSFHTIAGL